MLMEAAVLPVNLGLRNLELLLRQLEFLLTVVGFLSLLLKRQAHERGEPEQVEKQDVPAARRVVVRRVRHRNHLRPSGPAASLPWREPTAESLAKSPRESAVDTIVDAPYAGSMNLQVPPQLEAKLTRLAAETGRTADQVALDLLASSMDHDEWFRAQVEKGRAAAREGRTIEHDDVAARMDRRYRG